MQVLLQSLAWSILVNQQLCPCFCSSALGIHCPTVENKSVQVAVVPEISHVPQDTGWSVATHTCVTQPGQLPYGTKLCSFNLQGEANRMVAEHQLNRESSRSHTIFSIMLERSTGAEGDEVIVSKLNLVDLAGSERISKTKSEGTVLKEAQQINKSLSFLEQVPGGLRIGCQCSMDMPANMQAVHP